MKGLIYAWAAFCFLVVALSSSVVEAQALLSPNAYSQQENRRVLEGIIKEAQEALDTLDDPGKSKDGRAQRNRRERGQPRIVNGRGTVLYPAVGELLHEDDAQHDIAWCTVTLIGADQLLTAAHCIADDQNLAHYRVFFQSAGFYDIKAIYWQQNIFDFPEADVAVLQLSDSINHILPEKILSSVSVLPGTFGTIVGFGRTGGFQEDYGIKREGFVETAVCPSDRMNKHLLCWNFSAEVQNGVYRSNTCNADSGGPLFVYDTVMGHQIRFVAGVTSGGKTEDCLLGDQSFDADVLFYSKWIASTAGVERTQTDIRPDVPRFIDPSQDIVGTTATLNEGRTSVDLPFQVRAGTRRLMVAMNGDDNGRLQNAFKFVVSVDGEEMCKSHNEGVFGFCSVDSPKDGAWDLTVSLVKGRGTVQLAVTELP